MQADRTEGEGYDRLSLRLPGAQEVLAEQLQRMTDTPLVVVLIQGGPLDVQQLEGSDRVDAILTAWFPGQVPPTPCIASSRACTAAFKGQLLTAGRAGDR